jgi:acetate kinase
VLNCGSSSVKSQVIATSAGGVADRRLARGAVDRIGDGAQLLLEVEGRPAVRAARAVPDHDAAVRHLIDAMAGAGIEPAAIEAVGHRVVHGGERFTEAVAIDDDVIAGIEELEELAPLHNAPSLAGIRACRQALGSHVPMVAVFDTAFHAGLPEHAHRYAIPYELSLRHRLRRYGFHGLAYRSVVDGYHRLTRTPPGAGAIVAFHLGNGCSAAAIRNDAPVDTSMGLTPLEGLVMGTRSGDLDPAVVGYLGRREGLGSADVDRLLNDRSGLLGVSGRSRDMRDLLDAAPGDSRARLAVEIFCHRARKYLGAYLAALGGADAVVFSGGIGEHAPEIRARICQGFGWCGLALDTDLNAAAVGRPGRLSTDDARVGAFVIPADEEQVIARDTARLAGPPVR